ncbi:ANTAR domain-containing protein [Streptomyces arenae]|uniref:ANTAR domain-containing protein n=1 Tax=Streptomyces arenae TaxID=29301 RepID=UPI002658FAD7|nr:ANTAR domain-containing protein [Streptomyces arenae]MCG7204081.1 ANTAR domain-containing protein [Streptomyces arenae]
MTPPTLSARAVGNGVLVLRLSGAVDTHDAAALGDELCDRLVTAPAGQRLVLELTGTEAIGTTAWRILDARIQHLGEPLLVVSEAPQIVAAFAVLLPRGLRLHPTLDAALAALPGTASAAGSAGTGAQEPQGDPWSEVFGLRAKLRSHSLIGMAQGMLYERYRLSRPEEAFDQLRDTSQHHNVPLRVLASAVLTAPPAPAADGDWFPGRRPVVAPHMKLLDVQQPDVRDRRHVLRAAVGKAVTISAADAVELHLTDPAQHHALVLEEHANLDAVYRDAVAHVTGPPALCAQTRDHKGPVSVPDAAGDRRLSDTPEGQALLAMGSRALHVLPCLTGDGDCTGTLTFHHAQPGAWLTSTQHIALERLAADLAAWRSWYRRTVILDALERLHARCRSVA